MEIKGLQVVNLDEGNDAMRRGAKHTHILLGLLLVGIVGGQAWAFESPGILNKTAYQPSEVAAAALVPEASADLERTLEPRFSDEHGTLKPGVARSDHERSVKADGRVMPARDRHDHPPDVIVGLDLQPSLAPNRTGRRGIQTTDGEILGWLQVLPIAFGVSGTETPDGLVLLAF